MKSKYKKAVLIIGICVVISTIIIASLVYTEMFKIKINRHYESYRADDTISTAIMNRYSDKVIYRGKETNDYNATDYWFILSEKDEETITGIIKTANGIIEEQNMKQKILLTLSITFNGGQGTEKVLSVADFTDMNLESADCNKLQVLMLCGDDMERSEFYNNPATYRNIPDIRYLQLTYNMRVMAEQYKVDWYEYWPELEKIEELAY